MSSEQQRTVHLRLLDHAMVVWEQYFSSGANPTYVESVAGTIQALDVRLPSEALAAIRERHDQANIAARYREPIVSLQDSDLVLPESAEFAYYAVYNAFCLHVVGRKVDPWTIVNQVLSAVGVEQAIPVLDAAVNG
ncbi:hypothetical protein [Rhodanobacter sp. Soil772]|uniref:hypothetical protein n=1 Tax=Rhodanobacter sp. Soil772 TaxID=1736406 RepID=UPI0012FC1398|nr:hypothetical protein [Rhodanobacter sp. Soil772]